MPSPTSEFEAALFGETSGASSQTLETTTTLSLSSSLSSSSKKTTFSRPAKPTLITYPWKQINPVLVKDISTGIKHYLQNNALISSGRPNSLWKETTSLLPSLIKLNTDEYQFATLSSQPGCLNDNERARFYLTGILETSRCEQVLKKIQTLGFTVLINTNSKTTISMSPGTTVDIPIIQAQEDASVVEDSVLPLTLVRTGKRWNCTTSFPLPFPLQELLNLDIDVDVDDEGGLMEHHLYTNFERILSPQQIKELMQNSVVLTVVGREWGPIADVEELVECFRFTSLEQGE